MKRRDYSEAYTDAKYQARRIRNTLRNVRRPDNVRQRIEYLESKAKEFQQLADDRRKQLEEDTANYENLQYRLLELGEFCRVLKHVDRVGKFVPLSVVWSYVRHKLSVELFGKVDE